MAFPSITGCSKPTGVAPDSATWPVLILVTKQVSGIGCASHLIDVSEMAAEDRRFEIVFRRVIVAVTPQNLAALCDQQLLTGLFALSGDPAVLSHRTLARFAELTPGAKIVTFAGSR